jgi:ribonuclease P protein component
MSVNIRRPRAQAYLPTKEASPFAQAWVHAQEQHQERPGRAETAHAEGQVAARRLSPSREGRAIHAHAVTSMRKELRLRRRKDFDAVFQRGRAWHNELLVLRSLPNDLEHNRYGFVTGKRLGGAVIRNRLRRRLRESIRVLPAKPGWDVVVSAKIPAARASFPELNRSVVDLLGRAGIVDRSISEEQA